MKKYLILCVSIFFYIFFSTFTYAAQITSFVIEPSKQYEEVEAKMWVGLHDSHKNEYVAFEVNLKEGWKTYWLAPGDAGLPPEIQAKEDNTVSFGKVEFVEPQKINLLGTETFGYGDHVVFPVKINRNAAKDGNIDINFRLLVCADLCIPADFSFKTSLPSFDDVTSNDLSKKFSKIKAQIPFLIEDITPFGNISISDDMLSLNFKKEIFSAPLSSSPLRLVFVYDDLYAQDMVIYDVNTRVALSEYQKKHLKDIYLFGDEIQWVIEKKSFQILKEEKTSWTGWIVFLRMAFFAFLGGLILNIMPCVLPALGLKFFKLSKLREKIAMEESSIFTYRFSVLSTILGIFTLFLMLALILMILKYAGLQIGWGIQFQQPIFLWFMIGLMLYFTRWLAFIRFQKELPLSIRNIFSKDGRNKFVNEDFLLGFSAALLATPCSAPFLGTAIAFAFAGSIIFIIPIFFFLALGFASPWFVILFFPKFIAYLPKPGKWMQKVQIVFAFFTFSTAAFLTYILEASIGNMAYILFVMWLVLFSAGPFFDFLKLRFLYKVTLGAFFLSICFGALIFYQIKPESSHAPASQENWQAFSMENIEKLQLEKRNIFVDVTADWCITCKFNKNRVLDSSVFNNWAEKNHVVLLVADWTLQDDKNF